MSFADFGLEIFPYNARNYPHIHGDYLYNAQKLPKENTHVLDSSCYHLVIDHLIDLGSSTESQLFAVKAELEKFKKLKLTREQARQLGLIPQIQYEGAEKNFGEPLSEINAPFDKLAKPYGIRNPFNELGVYFWNFPGLSLFKRKHSPVKNVPAKRRKPNFAGNNDEMVLHERDTSINDATFKTTIIQKDSEIISLKNAKAVKETEVKELEDQNRQLEMVVDRMKDDIEILESSSRISQSQIQEIVLQKNEELSLLRENIEKLEHRLREERDSRSSLEHEVKTLETIVRETQVLRKNLSDELKMMRQQTESLDSSNESQLAVIKELRQERESLNKQNCSQENEIEKLLNIVKRLNDNYDRSKADLVAARAQLDVSEKKVSQCKLQLTTMEREVSKLINDLAECLGCTRALKTIKLDRYNMCAQARELAKVLNKIVREHEKCRMNKIELIKEIDKIGGASRAVASVGAIEGLKPSLSHEICRLKRVVMGNDDYRAIKSDVRGIVDDLLTRMDSRATFEKTECVYMQVASEASVALRKLDERINDHEVYQRCERFLLLELENLQLALDAAVKIINGLESKDLLMIDKTSMQDLYGDENKILSGDDPSAIVQSPLSKKILQRVQTSTQIVVRITTALRDDSALKSEYNKSLEKQLEQAMSELTEIGIEKCQLKDRYDECLNQTRELESEIERIRATLEEKTRELELVNDEMKAKIESSTLESASLRKQLSSAEKKYLDSRADNSALIKKSEEMIESLRRDLQFKNFKLQEYCEINDALNSKCEESYKMLQQLQSKVVEESMRKVDIENLAALEERITDLEKEKGELIGKIAILESQLSSYERNNTKLQSDLAKMSEDNERLKKCVDTLKLENERYAVNVKKRDTEQMNLSSKCAELCVKIERMQEYSRMFEVQSAKSDGVLVEMEKEMKSVKDKLCYQQKELLMKEKEIQDKNREIDVLKAELTSKEMLTLLRKMESMNREKVELKNEMEQITAKYEDKLAEMYKKYKHSESELKKSHQESIMNLEAKYMEMKKEEEGKVFNSQSWVQTLTEREKQELHDRICKTPLCDRSTYERDIMYEEHKRRALDKSNNISSARYGSKRPLPKKVEVRISNNSATNVVKPVSRQRHSARDSVSNHSMIPEKDNSHHGRVNLANRVK